MPVYDGYTVVEGFVLSDSRGIPSEQIPCSNPVWLRRVLIGKRQLNWHMRQWSESLREGSLSVQELREWFPWFPEWVFTGVKRQSRRLRSPSPSRPSLLQGTR